VFDTRGTRNGRDLVQSVGSDHISLGDATVTSLYGVDRTQNSRLYGTFIDATVLPKDQVEQKDNLRAMFVQGHASNSITRIPESLKGLKKLDLLVVADPHPTTWAALAVQAGRIVGLKDTGQGFVCQTFLASRI